jgi:hypothetical protein
MDSKARRNEVEARLAKISSKNGWDLNEVAFIHKEDPWDCCTPCWLASFKADVAWFNSQPQRMRTTLLNCAKLRAEHLESERIEAIGLRKELQNG